MPVTMKKSTKIILFSAYFVTLLWSASSFAPAHVPNAQIMSSKNLNPNKLMKFGLSSRSARRRNAKMNSNMKTKTNTNTQLSLSLEDLVYNAQSTASSLATSSLYSASSPASLVVLYFAGLLTSFSPCSLGLLPLTISYISSAAGEREDKEVFLPTVAFAAGLAMVFCGLGLSVSFLGGVFGSSSSNGGDSVLGALALASVSSGISIAMGLQLLELVNLPLPSLEFGPFAEEQNQSQRGRSPENECTDTSCPMPSPSPAAVALGESSNISFGDGGNIVVMQQESSSPITNDGTVAQSVTSNSSSSSSTSALFRTFLLGGSSALVASPCATPVLTSILGFVAASQDPVLGAALLLIYTVGYSTPLLIVGASGGQALVNLQMAADNGEDTMVGKIGQWVNPITASVLVYFGDRKSVV